MFYQRLQQFSATSIHVSNEKINNKFPLFTLRLGSIYSTNASGAERMPEANNLNQT